MNSDLEQINVMLHHCDNCIQSSQDVLNVNKKYITEFYTDYFRDNGVKSSKKVKTHHDQQWNGTSVDFIFQDAKKHKFNQELMTRNMLQNPEYVKNNLNLLIRCCNKLRQKCKSAIYEDVLVINNELLLEFLILIEKDIISHVINNS